MKVDPQSPVHPYMQPAGQLREQIERGLITSQLRSITELTAQTGLAVGTVRRAIDILIKEGLAQTVPGRGTFVTGKRSASRTCPFTSMRAQRTLAKGPRTTIGYRRYRGREFRRLS